LTIQTPSDAAAATAVATVFGMSWNFQEDAISAFHEGAHHRRALGREQPAADLESTGHAAQ
jgi:hypothetical protein